MKIINIITRGINLLSRKSGKLIKSAKHSQEFKQLKNYHKIGIASLILGAANKLRRKADNSLSKYQNIKDSFDSNDYQYKKDKRKKKYKDNNFAKQIPEVTEHQQTDK